MKLNDLVYTLGAFLMARDAAPFILGISGGQGAGNSTLCEALTEALEKEGKTALTLSLDDFYLPKSDRQHLARTIHPLCATRGVPGTHDVALLADTLRNIKQVSPARAMHLPRFSKSHDDRLPSGAHREIIACPDFIFLEGWCVGGHADCVEESPQNSWEEAHDPQAIWKKWSRMHVGAYQPIWDMCHATLLLRQENFEAVIDSRWLQEQGNARASGVWQFADRAAVAEFCAHYKSWTLGIWEDLTPRADFVISRNADYDYHPLKVMNKF